MGCVCVKFIPSDAVSRSQDAEFYTFKEDDLAVSVLATGAWVFLRTEIPGKDRQITTQDGPVALKVPIFIWLKYLKPNSKHVIML